MWKTPAEKIALIRQARNITQRELAERVGKNTGYISNIEQGIRNPGTDLVKTILSEYDISRQWWDHGEGDMFRRKPDTVDAPEGVMEAQIYAMVRTELGKTVTDAERFELAADLRDFFKERGKQ